MQYPDCFRIIEEKVKPERIKLKDNADGERRKKFWWQYGRIQREIVETMTGLEQVMVSTRVTKYFSVSIVPTRSVLSVDLAVHCGLNPSYFSVLSSSIFDIWARETSSTLETRLRFSISDSFETFPFPSLSSYSCDSCDSWLTELGERYHEHRRCIMLERQEGLTKTYNRFHDAGESSGDIVQLRQLHVEMDSAVAAAYSWDDLDLGHGFHQTKQGLRYTIGDAARREVLARLLTLNHERYADEVKQGLHEKKKPRNTRKTRKKTEEGEMFG